MIHTETFKLSREDVILACSNYYKMNIKDNKNTKILLSSTGLSIEVNKNVK